MNRHHPGEFTGTEAAMIATAKARGYEITMPGNDTIARGHGQEWTIVLVHHETEDALAWVLA